MNEKTIVAALKSTCRKVPSTLIVSTNADMDVETNTFYSVENLLQHAAALLQQDGRRACGRAVAVRDFGRKLSVSGEEEYEGGYTHVKRQSRAFGRYLSMRDIYRNHFGNHEEDHGDEANDACRIEAVVCWLRNHVRDAADMNVQAHTWGASGVDDPIRPSGPGVGTLTVIETLEKETLSPGTPLDMYTVNELLWDGGMNELNGCQGCGNLKTTAILRHRQRHSRSELQPICMEGRHLRRDAPHHPTPKSPPKQQRSNSEGHAIPRSPLGFEDNLRPAAHSRDERRHHTAERDRMDDRPRDERRRDPLTVDGNPTEAHTPTPIVGFRTIYGVTAISLFRNHNISQLRLWDSIDNISRFVHADPAIDSRCDKMTQPDLERQNGIAQSAIALARAIAPSLSTSLFSLSVQHNLLGGNLVYVFFLRLSCGALVLARGLPAEVEGIDYGVVYTELERGDKVPLPEAGNALLGEGKSATKGVTPAMRTASSCASRRSASVRTNERPLPVAKRRDLVLQDTAFVSSPVAALRARPVYRGI
ncbi:hypothetical protein R3P38DRAFT_3522668 [Favolaschia claudopus]|uniref:Uncharacterized protein n=1 Tax=Favolaschia claudopus TaxID=2862362 RepID=A0AAW0E8F7_9AGAR